MEKIMKIIFIGVNVPAKTEYSFTQDESDIGRVIVTMGNTCVSMRDDQFYHIFEKAKTTGQPFFRIDFIDLSMTQGYQIEKILL